MVMMLTEYSLQVDDSSLLNVDIVALFRHILLSSSLLNSIPIFAGLTVIYLKRAFLSFNTYLITYFIYVDKFIGIF